MEIPYYASDADDGSMLVSEDRTHGINEKYRDTLFRKLFRDEARALELYAAITGDKSAGNVTICSDDEFFMRQQDLAFSVEDAILMMFEHQTAPTPNMPLRILLYYAQLLREQVVGNKKMYGGSRVRVQTPRFYVLYNGDEPLQNHTLKLSDAFMRDEGGPALELTVEVIDITWSDDNPILKKSETLSGYSYLVAQIKKNKLAGMDLGNAIGAAIKTCIAEGRLADFLDENYREVAEMLAFEYDYETEKEVIMEEGIEKGIEIGKTEGIEIGKTEVKAEIITKMVKSGMGVDQICSITGYSAAEINRLTSVGSR